MRNIHTNVFLILSSLLLAVSTFAADVQMTLQPQLISLLDRAVLKIEYIDCRGKAVDIPAVEGLQIQYQGQSSQTQIINFKSSSKTIHTYLITPTKVGDYTIGPVNVKYKGGEKDVSAKLRVIKRADDKEAQELSEIMFSRISTDREAPYVHEPFDLTVKVFIREGVQIDGNFSLRGGIPESGMEGELQWQVAKQERSIQDGTIFNVYTLGTTARTLTAGSFSFSPEVQVNIIVPRQRRRPYGFDDPFFGDFFGRQEVRPVVLDCNTLNITVKPVPTENRPESFTGGVGVFDFNVSLAPTTVKVGEPITLKMSVSGKGNINQLTPPVVDTNHEFKLYDARSLPKTPPNEVVFEQVIIPKSENVNEIPAISFTYFNTTTDDFRTISKGPFPVTIAAAPAQAAKVIASVSVASRQETKVLGHDIVYLKSLPKTWRIKEHDHWHQTKLVYILIALPALLLAGVAGLTARRNTLAGNVALARRQQAPKAARQFIQQAEQALRKEDANAFYEALWNALTGYFGHRLNLAPGEITLQTVLAHMPEQKEALESLFNNIEQRRYGIQSSDGDAKDSMKTLLKQLNDTFRTCERMKR